ncbi:MAG: 2-phospho-L-lactate transferase [Acidimicrobiia bacterium]|nr:2-phospho-L-lactate transferase [Acidimicrobiia bacterium]
MRTARSAVAAPGSDHGSILSARAAVVASTCARRAPTSSRASRRRRCSLTCSSTALASRRSTRGAPSIAVRGYRRGRFRWVIVALAGGVGAARFLRGLVEVCAQQDVTVIVNTGDDVVLHGLHVSPDIDTVVYTLAGAVNPETGWGLANETWTVMDALAPYGGLTWFRLGDRDLATHLYRTQRLAEGATLSEVTSELAGRWGLELRVVPMSDDRVETRLEVEDEGEVAFQEYFVRRRHSVPVGAVRYAGASEAAPAPGVLDALTDASRLIVCPSNPILSIAPILAVPGIEAAVAARREDVWAISPIVAGAALKGPADRLMAELGLEASVVGMARLYAPFAGTLVVDEADAALAAGVEAEGVRCVVAPTVMHGLSEATALAKTVLDA